MQTCGKDFANVRKLNLYYYTHTDKQPYKFKQYNEAYYRAAQLKKHLRAHSELRTL